jgi:prepilin-type N-terminal cleavage/methylation domain-containing protein
VNRRGMTLVELLMVLAVAGILANLALPAIADARRRANAMRVIGDFAAIRVAALDRYAATGTFPGSAPRGQVPAALVSALPAGFPFRHNSVTYRWRRWSLPNGMPRLRSQIALLGLEVATEDRALLKAITSAYHGPKFGSSRTVTLVID